MLAAASTTLPGVWTASTHSSSWEFCNTIWVEIITVVVFVVGVVVVVVS
jgi:hypothetical protein